MVKLEDLHIGDKVHSVIAGNKICEVVKLESIPYINYQKELKKIDNSYDKIIYPFVNDHSVYIGRIYNSVTLKIEGDDFLVGTDVSNITEIIKNDNKDVTKKDSFIKRLITKLFNK